MPGGAERPRRRRLSGPALPRSAPAPAESAPAAAPAAAPSAAHEAAHRIIDDAIAQGAWRAEEAQALRTTMTELSQAEVEQTVGELSRAINTGRLQVTTRPLF